MELLRRRSAAGDFPPVLIVHCGSPEEGERFFAERWPEARAVSDPSKELYRGFDLRRGRLTQLLGLRSILAGLRALRFGVGRPEGDPRMLSGWFLVEADGRVVWSQRHDFAGEEPRVEELLEAWVRR